MSSVETFPAPGSKTGVSTPLRVSLWPVKAVLHQAGRDPLAGHADVLFAVKDASETTERELDCGLDGLDGLDGPVGPEGLDGLEGVNELAGLALTAEHADIPRQTTVKAAKRTKETQRLMDPPLLDRQRYLSCS